MIHGLHKYLIYGLLSLIALVDIPLSYAQRIDVALPTVHFTHPDVLESGEKDGNLIQWVIDLIHATPASEEITVCIFKMNDTAIIRALEAAQERGVHIRMILNDGDTSEEINEEADDMLKDTFDHYYYIENDISGKAIIHNKFILFSSVETTAGLQNHIVLQTSSNFYKKGTKKIQDMLIFQDKEIYYGYLDYWYYMKVFGETGELDDFNYFNVTSKDGKIKAYFYPKRRDKKSYGKDDIVKALEKIEDPSNCHLRIAHVKWDEQRIDIVKALEGLIGHGALVEIITSADNDKDILKELEKLNARLKVLKKDEFDLHTKFFLLQKTKNNRVVQEVWTGSHNLTDRSLRKNFEVLLKIEDEDLYSSYLNYFKLLIDLD